jgi:hypothetical protein
MLHRTMKSGRRQAHHARRSASPNERARDNHCRAGSITNLIQHAPRQFAHCLNAHLLLAVYEVQILQDGVGVAKKQATRVLLAD